MVRRGLRDCGGIAELRAEAGQKFQQETGEWLDLASLPNQRPDLKRRSKRPIDCVSPSRRHLPLISVFVLLVFSYRCAETC